MVLFYKFGFWGQISSTGSKALVLQTVYFSLISSNMYEPLSTTRSDSSQGVWNMH